MIGTNVKKEMKSVMKGRSTILHTGVTMSWGIVGKSDCRDRNHR